MRRAVEILYRASDSHESHVVSEKERKIIKIITFTKYSREGENPQ